MEERRDLDVLFVFLDIRFLLENTSVYQSQVGDQLVALSRMRYATGLLAVSRDRAAFERVIGARLREARVEIILVPESGFLRCLWRLAAALRRVTRTRRVRRAYARGIWGVVVIALAGQRGKLGYVYDVRGSMRDEMDASGTARFKRVIYGALEQWCIRGAERVSAVTGALAEVVTQEHRPDGVSVVPCCVDVTTMTVSDEQAAARRAELGFAPHECVLVYSGGLSFYQQVPAMLAIWRRLSEEPDIRFLLLTNEDPHLAPMVVGDLRDFGDRLVQLSLPHESVAVTLAAADVGFMLRDTRELNRVASPVKFPEYLSAGLAIVASPGTGDASSLVEQHDVGTLVDPADIDRGVANVRALVARWRVDAVGYRRRARMLVTTHYDWSAHADTFQQLYGAVPEAAPSVT